jgi:alpha-mannosidase
MAKNYLSGEDGTGVEGFAVNLGFKLSNGKEYIFRFFECANSTTDVKIAFGFDVQKVALCDMSENTLEELESSGNTVDISFGAFEIQTLKVTAKG